MQAYIALLTLIGVLGAPAVAGYFQLRAGQRKREAEAVEAQAETVQSDAVDVYALLRESIIREAELQRKVKNRDVTIRRLRAQLKERPPG